MVEIAPHMEVAAACAAIAVVEAAENPLLPLELVCLLAAGILRLCYRNDG